MRVRPAPWILLLLLAAHAAGVLGVIGVDRLQGSAPVVDQDYGMHFHRAASRRESSWLLGPVWDPSYMAGAPIGGASDVDNQLGWLGMELLAALPAGQAFNWTIALLYLLVPLLPLIAVRASGGGPGAGTWAAALSILAYWSMTSHSRAWVSWGVYGWVVASAGAPLLWIALTRPLEKPSAGSVLGGGVAIAFVGLAHGLIGVLLPLIALAVLARRPTRKGWAAWGATVAVAAALVLPISWPVLATLGDAQSQSEGLAVYFQSSLSAAHHCVTLPRQIPKNLLLLLGLSAVLSARASRTDRELGLAGAGLSVLALGSFLIAPLAPLQPLRFLTPALFLAIVPAARILADCTGRLMSAGRPARLAVAATAAALLVPTLDQWLGGVRGAARLHTQGSPEAVALVDRLRECSLPDRRVLAEDDGDYFGGRHFGAPNLISYLAREIDRPLIGGPHPVTSCRGSFATLENGVLFGRPVAEYGDDELRGLVREYAIGTVFVWSEPSIRRFDRMGWPREALDGGFVIYQVPEPSRLAEASGPTRVRAQVNRIEVTGAASSPVLLRFHHDPRFRTEPPLPVRRVPSEHNPLGFLEVENGDVQDFTVLFDGGLLP